MPCRHISLFFIIFLAAAGPFLLVACREPPPLRVAASLWPGYDLLFLARDKQWLDRSKVRLVETPSASESMHALATGLVDGAALTLDEVLRMRDHGVPLTVVLVFDTSFGADVLLARPGIMRLADLRGRRIGVENTALGALMLASVLETAGLTPEEVVKVQVSIDRHKQVWQRREVDALITYEPTARAIADQGGVRLFDSRQIPDRIVDVLAIRTDVLSQRREAVRHLVAGYFRALGHLRQNPNDAAYRLAVRMKLPPAQVLAVYRTLRQPDAIENRRLLGGTSPDLVDTAARLVRVMLDNGLLRNKGDLQGLLDADFLPVE